MAGAELGPTSASETDRIWRSGNVVVRREWIVGCRDAAGRRRSLTVLVDEGQIVVISPPGEAAVLAPLEVGELRVALRQAAMAAVGAEL